MILAAMCVWLYYVCIHSHFSGQMVVTHRLVVLVMFVLVAIVIITFIVIIVIIIIITLFAFIVIIIVAHSHTHTYIPLNTITRDNTISYNLLL